MHTLPPLPYYYRKASCQQHQPGGASCDRKRARFAACTSVSPEYLGKSNYLLFSMRRLFAVTEAMETKVSNVRGYGKVSICCVLRWHSLPNGPLNGLKDVSGFESSINVDVYSSGYGLLRAGLLGQITYRYLGNTNTYTVPTM